MFEKDINVLLHLYYLVKQDRQQQFGEPIHKFLLDTSHSTSLSFLSFEAISTVLGILLLLGSILTIQSIIKRIRELYKARPDYNVHQSSE